MWDFNLVREKNIKTCPQLLTLWFSLAWSRTTCNVQSKFLILASGKMCQMLPQRMLSLEDHSIHQHCMVGQRKLSRDQYCFSSFWLAQFHVSEEGSVQKCNGLDGNPINSMWGSCTRSGLFCMYFINVVPGKCCLNNYDWLFAGKGSSLSCTKAIFCRQSTVLISSICEYAIPCPHQFSIWISSILFVKDLTAYGSNICLGGTCRSPVTPYIMSWPKEPIRCRTRWGYSVGTALLPFKRV